MSNPYDGMDAFGLTGAAANHKTGALSSVASTVALSAGWWKISANQDYYWLTSKTSTAVTTSTGTHEWAKDTPEPIFVPPEETRYLSVIKVSTTGTYYIDRVKRG